ncbi:hypothetical protein BCV71DRAFT_285265 [Rhizopus microsporus]|uniref:Cas12f1-like TNB domain-containing protein n=1 Tax=Rhizopus microsporus TaxID=58291 RepID=A0A1X0S2H3_RHIZD|nr:hypothetical protein BCV71DRAFT_285265 [Rhizopus microsporus]
MKPQDKASNNYVHRKLQLLSFVKKLNTSKYRSVKENTLTAINSNKILEIASKLKNIDKEDIDIIQTFIKTVQARMQDKTFMPLKYTDPRGSRYFSLLPLYKIDSKSIQIDAQSFWKLAEQCDIKIKPGQKNDNDLTLWCLNVFDFSKIGYKTLESLTSCSKKFAYLTSQICNKCKSKQLNNISITGSKRRVHFVLKCESCGTVWNRDVNSALNIYDIFVYKSKHDNESPLPFKRPSED